MSMSGWLEKKSQKTFGGYQKRFFKIINGQYLTYSEKEADISKSKVKIMLDTIGSIQKKEDKKLRLQMSNEDKMYHLKAKTKEARDKWAAALELLLTLNQAQNQKDRAVSEMLPEKKDKIDKIEKIEKKKDVSPPKNKKISNNKDSNKNIKLNEKFLDKRGITSLISLSNPEIKKRFFSGFLKREKKNMELNKKKYWVVLFSSRPLRNSDYENDDKTIDDSKLKEWLQFDTLFFFHVDEDDEKEPQKQPLKLKECDSITCEDKDKKFCITLAIGDQNYFFYNKFQEERDLWFEVMKNSRRTAKEIANSVTKKPRNMVRLINIFDKKGKDGYFEELEKEKKKNLGNFLKIHDFDTLAFVLGEYEKMISEILDGCLLCYKENGELFETTVDYFIDSYMKIVCAFWEYNYNRLDNEKILKLSNILFNYEELLKKFRIEDENVSRNANELVKIYIKKIYKQLLEFIQNILKSEREIKQIENSKKELITNGPNDLFTMLTNIITANRSIQVPYIHTYVLNMLYEGIIQFLIGTDCITSNYNLKVEPEYLIAIANNTTEFLPLLNNFIDKYKEGCVLSEKRINDEIHMKSILTSLNLLRQNVILRFVILLSKPLAESFNCYYHLLDLNKIIDITSDVYFKYNSSMSGLIKKRVWEEILKLTVYYYMKLMIMTSSKGIKNADELVKKLMEDKNILKDVYSTIVGENLTLVNLKIFDDVLSFLRVDPCLISTACINLRKFCGKMFDINMVGKLLQFRIELSPEEIKDVIQACQEFFENYKEEDTDKKSFFEDMEQKTERRTSVKKRMERRSRIRTRSVELKQGFLDGLEQGELETNIFKYEDFIDEEDEDEDSDDSSENKEDEEKKENKENENKGKKKKNNTKKVEDEKVSDVIMEGKMKKKTLANYQNRFFQLKNGYLYWYLDEKSRNIKNKINLKNIKKIEYPGPCKITITVEDPKDKQSGTNVFKFKTADGKSKVAWIDAITAEMKKVKGENKETNNTIYQTERQKKCIKDYLQLPDIGTERTNIKLQIISQIKEEGYFPLKEPEKKEETNNNKASKARSSVINVKNTAETSSSEKNENYEPHAALFNEGELKQYDVGLEEAKQDDEDEGTGFCCGAFFGLFSSKKNKKAEEQKNQS